MNEIARVLLAAALRRTLAGARDWLRGVSGDDACKRYLTDHARAHEGPI